MREIMQNMPQPDCNNNFHNYQEYFLRLHKNGVNIDRIFTTCLLTQEKHIFKDSYPILEIINFLEENK